MQAESWGRQSGYQVRVFQFLDDLDIVELDVEELIDRLERASDLNIVLQLDRHLVVDEGLEKAIEGLEGQRLERVSKTVPEKEHVGGWARGATGDGVDGRVEDGILRTQNSRIGVPGGGVIVMPCRLQQQLADA